jgi:hypothetical protein
MRIHYSVTHIVRFGVTLACLSVLVSSGCGGNNSNGNNGGGTNPTPPPSSLASL